MVTANAWSSEQSYVRVVQTNVDLYSGIIPSVAHLSPNAILLIASQPGGGGANGGGASCFLLPLTFVSVLPQWTS